MEPKILNELVYDLDRFWAHLPKEEEKNERKPELLIEHIERTNKYFKKIWQEKQIDNILDKFCYVLKEHLSAECKCFLQELIWGIPIFHDIGKINPLFQKNIMKNPLFGSYKNEELDDTHSELSSILYIAYFYKKLFDLIDDDDEHDILETLIFCNAYVISRHHSNLTCLEKFLELFKTEKDNPILNKNLSKKINLINNKQWHLYLHKIDWIDNDIIHSSFAEIQERYLKYINTLNTNQTVYVYTFMRLVYSMLLASDYYATAEYQNNIEIKQFGDIDEILNWQEIYESTSLMQSVRKYQQNVYPQSEADLATEKNINNLRSEIFCETEANLLQNYEQNIFYLEAPTGSGKSNTAINLSFQLMAKDSNLKKIFYIYPFNTLVEQNIETLEKIFGNNPEIMQKIAVINSLTPIKVNNDETDEKSCYQKALLDKQFLNYPMILSTHVSLFDTMFNHKKENVFGFYQLANSVIVLDEIQSYKNSLWGEIINFLVPMAKLLHMKIIIMSATLPNLNVLLERPVDTISLLKHKQKFFANNCFKKRVELSYELLKPGQGRDKFNLAEIDLQELKCHVQNVIEKATKPQKILVEFITRESAYTFFDLLEEDKPCEIELITGDTSLSERQRILDRIKSVSEHIILVATQVIEAGVDIDMSVGYKAISKLDSEEQFLGRINRSCKNYGVTYFFKKDNVRVIYKGDKRSEHIVTLENPDMRNMLISKDFQQYYKMILELISRHNKECNENNLNKIFSNFVAKLNFAEISRHMKLIDEKDEKSVFLAHKIHNKRGEVLDGEQIWNEYICLLKDFAMDYAEKQVKLSIIRSKMNEFIYQVREVTVCYDDRIGDLYYIKDGQKYIDEKFERKKIEGRESGYVDFI